MNFVNLLEGESGSSMMKQLPMIIILAVIIVAFIAYSIFSNRKRRKQMDEEREKRDAIQPGYKITTIGGIVGTVVEIDKEGNTFVLETGVGENKCTVTFDKQAIYTFEAPVSETAQNETDDVFGNAESEEKVEESASESEEKVEETAPESEEKTEEAETPVEATEETVEEKQ